MGFNYTKDKQKNLTQKHLQTFLLHSSHTRQADIIARHPGQDAKIGTFNQIDAQILSNSSINKMTNVWKMWSALFVKKQLSQEAKSSSKLGNQRAVAECQGPSWSSPNYQSASGSGSWENNPWFFFGSAKETVGGQFELLFGIWLLLQASMLSAINQTIQ